MSLTLSVSLGDELARFVEKQVNKGRYDDAEAVMHAGLRMLEETEARNDALLAAIDEGLASGISDQSVMDIWHDVLAENKAPHGA